MPSTLNSQPSTSSQGAKRWLLLGILLAVVVSMFSAQFNRYYLGILIDCGINIILAVSLNLINGHTGQFSLGHAGFMAVGGYTAAKFSLVFLPTVPEPLQPVLFLVALVLGGLVAALAGLGVGVPSLRLKGDYLAIVTLGFRNARLDLRTGGNHRVCRRCAGELNLWTRLHRGER